jgi:DNA-binding CsgD family transcriptional regulator
VRAFRQMLVGREQERERIDAALGAAQSGRATSLLLLGEAGIGKTALLEYAAEQAQALQIDVIRVRGLESEAEVAFGGLLVVCRPLLNHLDSLDEQHANALRAALGLRPDETPAVGGRLVVGAATLSLLAAAADRRPLLLIVDDANWLDGPSADALLFAAKRIEADAVVLLFAARSLDSTDLEEVRIGGLDTSEARELLGTMCHPDVVRSLAEQTGGNPLALLELPHTLSDAQLQGVEPLAEPPTLSPPLLRAFAHRVTTLGDDVRRALLVAAASDNGDLPTILEALERLHLDSTLLEAAEDNELVSVDDDMIEFRHPLVRSATYHGAAPSERRRAHRALAAALAGKDDEREAWHRAAAAFGRDEGAARLLDATAERSRARAAYAVASAAHERAARLGDEARRSERLRLAADGAWHAGQPTRASRLVDDALGSDATGEIRGELIALRAKIELYCGDQRRAYRWFLEAADLVEPTNSERTAEILAEAISAGIQTADSELATVAQRLERSRAARDPFVELLLEQALVIAGSVDGAKNGAGRLLQSVTELVSGEIVPQSSSDFFAAARACWVVGRNADAASFSRDGVWRARNGQASGLLPQLLRGLALAEYDRGEWASARAAAAEGAELAQELGQTTIRCACLGLLAELEAAIGDVVACEDHAREASQIAVPLGLDFFRERAERALGRLRLVRGELDAAVAQFEEVAARLTRSGNHELNVTPLPDLVEVYARLGKPREAQDALARLEALTSPTFPGEEALFERSRGIAGDEMSFPTHFERALELHEEDLFPFEQARTELCYGERLRRARERRAAREPLQKAAGTFERLGAVGWAKRAHHELRATGQRPRRRESFEDDLLTPREAQIADQVGQGKSNREVAAALYLTPKTVEFHLTRIYRKLGVRSRSELVRKLSTAGDASRPLQD